MDLYSLVVVVHFGGDAEIGFCLFRMAETEVSEAHQVVAVDAVLLVHIVFPNLEIRKGDGEIIHLESVEQVLFPKIDQAVETAAGLLLTSKFAKAAAGWLLPTLAARNRSCASASRPNACRAQAL